MPDDAGNGIRARLDMLQARQSEVFERLRTIDRMEPAVAELNRKLDQCVADSKATRIWVEEQMEGQERERKKEASEALERRRLSRGERLSFAAAGIAAIAATTGVIALLNGAS